MTRIGENNMTFRFIGRIFFQIFIKPLSFLPALLIMLCIYSFSAQDGTTSSDISSNITEKIVYSIDRFLDFGLTENQVVHAVERIHHYIRKTAHFMEYLLLAVSLSFPLYVYNLRGMALTLTVGLICVGYAGFDEFHQLFVAGRSGSIKDVFIDSCGAFIGILLVRLICYILRKTVVEPLSKS